MTKSAQFGEYAKEAIAWSHNAKTEDERRALIQLASTWTRAAMYSEEGFDKPLAA